MTEIGDAAEVSFGEDRTVGWQTAQDANRELWNDRAALHESLYDAHGLAADPQAISPVVRDDLPILVQHLAEGVRTGDAAGEPDQPLRGLDLAHLQCHIGTDTISLARLGARVTGVDFSPASLEVARRLAAEAGLEIAWVESDVSSARASVSGDFDVVYTSVGTIVWLKDLATWARQIDALLRPGGVFYIRDGHPTLLALDENADAPVVGFRYFANGSAQTWNDGSTYAGEGTTAHTRSYEWPHSLSEIIESLLATGLVLERFDEGRSLPWCFSELTTPVDGAWEFGPEWRDKIPCTFTIVARKPFDRSTDESINRQTSRPEENRAKVVTLCGSTKFEAEFAEANQRLTLEGCVVISLGMFDLPDLPDYDWAVDPSDLKGHLGRVHFEKIRMADEVYIVDPGGYVGESTRREIAYAESLNTPVRYLSREG